MPIYLIACSHHGVIDETWISAVPADQHQSANYWAYTPFLERETGPEMVEALRDPANAQHLAMLAGAIHKRDGCTTWGEVEIDGVAYNRGRKRREREFSKPMEDLLDMLDESGIRRRS